MKRTLLIVCAVITTLSFRAYAQNEGFLTEMLYPMSGYKSANQPIFAVTFGHNLVVQQMADTINVGNWLNRTRMETPMDANGRFTKFKIANWEISGNKWGPNMLNMEFVYTYNASNKLTKYSRKQHINDTMYIKSDMTYMGSGPNGSPMLGNGLDSIFTTTISALVGMRADSFTYSGNNLTDYSSWDIAGSPSIEMNIKHSYNAGGKLETSISYEDDGSGNMIPVDRTELTYDADGNIATEISSEWNEANDTFEYTEKNVYTYATGTSRMVEQKSYEWGNNTFDLGLTMNLYYDANQKLDSISMVNLSESKEGYAKVNYDGSAYQSVYFYEKKGVTYVATERYIYTEPTTGLNDMVRKTQESMVYPNPSNGFFTVKGVTENSTITIYNLAGKSVLTANTANGEVNAAALGSGIYFFTLTNGSTIQNGKLIIE